MLCNVKSEKRLVHNHVDRLFFLSVHLRFKSTDHGESRLCYVVADRQFCVTHTILLSVATFFGYSRIHINSLPKDAFPS